MLNQILSIVLAFVVGFKVGNFFQTMNTVKKQIDTTEEDKDSVFEVKTKNQ